MAKQNKNNNDNRNDKDQKEKQGTIHEIETQLALIDEVNTLHPVTKAQIDEYTKIFRDLKLFTPAQLKDKKKRDAIIKNLKLINFNEGYIKREQQVLKSTINFNAIINRQLIKIENLIRKGKDVTKNENIRKGREKVEVKLPLQVRTDLKIHEKAIRLIKKSTRETSNKIKFYSGQDYDFLITDGFNRDYLIPYEKLQQIRKEGNLAEYLLKILEDGIQKNYDIDKRKYSKDKKKWNLKQRVYKKLFKVVNHNIQIATNQKYNKKLLQKNDKGEVDKDQSEYPVYIEIFAEMIELKI